MSSIDAHLACLATAVQLLTAALAYAIVTATQGKPIRSALTSDRLLIALVLLSLASFLLGISGDF